MCDRSQSTYEVTETTKLEDEPTDPGVCHIYYVHQDGKIRCEPDVPFKEDADSNQHHKNINEPDKSKRKLFCGDDRLTLIHLRSKDFKSSIYDNLDEPEKIIANPQAANGHWPNPSSDSIPEHFMEMLTDICEYCHCKGDILWRNLQRAEPHFDACFRYFDGKPEKSASLRSTASSDSPTLPVGPADPAMSQNPAVQVVPEVVVSTHLEEPVEHVDKKSHRRCFLKLYTLRVPFLARKTVALSLVHHIRAEGKNFVPSRADCNNLEHIFGFIAGFTSSDLSQLLTNRVKRWQDISDDHLVKATTGMTPRLFTAAVISQYGSMVAQEVMKEARTLLQCDRKLQMALRKLNDLEPGSSGDVTVEIGLMNETLINMNINLTGTRSTMHYLAESAHTLVNGVSTLEKYIQARLSEWKENADADALKKSLFQLDSCKESIRDNDKLELVRKTMQQYKVDIKALQQHIDIDVGMLRNLIAERDKVIQNVIAGNTARDGFIMKIITVLTAFFLPELS